MKKRIACLAVFVSVFLLPQAKAEIAKVDGGRHVPLYAPSAKRFALTSPAFKENAKIPDEYTCHGQNISPELRWKNVPKRTKSFVLIVDDPDVPGPEKVWIHWILFNIPADVNHLPKGIKALPDGTQQGVNSWGKLGYKGACPPDRRHRYYFTLYALDRKLNLPEGATKKEIQHVMDRYILGEVELIGVYSPKDR